MKTLIFSLLIQTSMLFADSKSTIGELAGSLTSNDFYAEYFSSKIEDENKRQDQKLKDDLNKISSKLQTISESPIDTIPFETLWTEIKSLIAIQKKITTSYAHFCTNSGKSLNGSMLSDFKRSCPDSSVVQILNKTQEYINNSFSKRIEKLNKDMGKEFLSCGLMKLKGSDLPVVNENLLDVTSTQIIEQEKLFPLNVQIFEEDGKVNYGAYYLNGSLNTCLKLGFKESTLYNPNADFIRAKDAAIKKLDNVVSGERFNINKCLENEMKRYLEPTLFYGDKITSVASSKMNRNLDRYKEIYNQKLRADLIRQNMKDKTNYSKILNGVTAKCQSDVSSCIRIIQNAMIFPTKPEICGDLSKYSGGPANRSNSSGGAR